MRMIRVFALISALLLALPAQAGATDSVVLAAGAGYKKMVNALYEAYRTKTGAQIDLTYGNMGKVTTLAKESGKVDIVLGDARLLLENAALAEAMSQRTDVRLIDLAPDNVGKTKRGLLVEGDEATRDAINWPDLLLVTGTTLGNGTIDIFLTGKPMLFYGTTIAGAAALMGLSRYCPQSS